MPVTGQSLCGQLAMEAWSRCSSAPFQALDATVIAETPKTLVCRLRGAARRASGTIIAKRRSLHEIEFEARVYRDILPKLPIPGLQFYGSVTDADPGFAWLFMEDAGDHPYSSDVPEHRLLGAQWLARVHSCPEVHSLAHLLPERDVAWYFQRGRQACARIREAQRNLALSHDDREILTTVLTRLDTIFEHEAEVDEACRVVSRTLVHGDFFPKNIRLRQTGAALALYPLDWETAAYAVPAADVAYHVDLKAYFETVRHTWPGIALHDLEQVARCGRVLRMMVVVEWSSYGLDSPWCERPMGQMRTYRTWLADRIQEMGW